MNGIVARFDLRDSGIVAASESRVGESESRIGESGVVRGVVHQIGIDSVAEFPRINGAKLLSKSSMKIDK